MEYRTLITADELSQLLGSKVVVVDCRFDLADPDAGFRSYRDGHIPGAVYAHHQQRQFLDRNRPCHTATTTSMGSAMGFL